jgi:hypothetical protein
LKRVRCSAGRGGALRITPVVGLGVGSEAGLEA